MKQIYVYLDPNNCTGCLTCELACEARDATSESIHNAMLTKPEPINRIFIEPGLDDEVGIVPIPVFCHHCNDAPCMKVCPVDAINTEDEFGVIELDREKCIGCRECMMACPFGVLKINDEGKMIKCDLCIERLKSGEEPACVKSCPMEILKYYDEEEYNIAVKEGHINEILKCSRYIRGEE